MPLGLFGQTGSDDDQRRWAGLADALRWRDRLADVAGEAQQRAQSLAASVGQAFAGTLAEVEREAVQRRETLQAQLQENWGTAWGQVGRQVPEGIERREVTRPRGQDSPPVPRALLSRGEDIAAVGRGLQQAVLPAAAAAGELVQGVGEGDLGRAVRGGGAALLDTANLPFTAAGHVAQQLAQEAGYGPIAATALRYGTEALQPAGLAEQGVELARLGVRAAQAAPGVAGRAGSAIAARTRGAVERAGEALQRAVPEEAYRLGAVPVEAAGREAVPAAAVREAGPAAAAQGQPFGIAQALERQYGRATPAEVTGARVGAALGGTTGAVGETPEQRERGGPTPVERLLGGVAGTVYGAAGGVGAVRLGGAAARMAAREAPEMAGIVSRDIPGWERLAALRVKAAEKVQAEADALRDSLEARYARWDALQQRVSELETSVALTREQGAIERPPWARGGGGRRALSDSELAYIAEIQWRTRPEPLNPYTPGWWQEVDPDTVRTYRAEWQRSAPPGIGAHERAQEGKRLRAELAAAKGDLGKLDRGIETDLRRVGNIETRAERLQQAAGTAAQAGQESPFAPLEQSLTALRAAAARRTGTAPGPPGGRQIAAGVEAAPGETAAQASRAGFVANIRLSQLPEELRDTVVQQVDRLPPEVIDAARRGEISHDLTNRMADALGLTREQWARRIEGGAKGKAYNAEELTALDNSFLSAMAEVKRLSQSLASGEVALRDVDQTRTELAASVMQGLALARGTLGARAEAGRALNAMKILRRATEGTPTPERLRRAVALVNESVLQGKPGEDLIQKLAAAADDPIELFSLVRQAQTPSFWERFSTYYRANLLSNPLTQVRNVMGNLGAMALQPLERTGAALTEAVAAPLQGRQRERYFGEAWNEWRGYAAAFALAGQRAGNMLVRGFSDADALKLELRHKPFSAGIENPVLRTAAKAVELPFRGLSAADASFRTLAESGELWAQAYRAASKEGLKGPALEERVLNLVASPTDEMILAAEQAGKYRTYSQTLDQYGQAVTQLARRPGLDLVLPFVATPWNIAKYELERSPLGALSVGQALATRQGAGEVADRMGRLLLGSAVFTGMVLWAKDQDVLTGRAPDNAAERDLFYREGKLPYAIKLGGQWVSYSQWTGLAGTLAMAAETAQLLRRGQQPRAADWMSGALKAAGVITDKPFLLGLKRLEDAIASPDKAGSLVEGLVGGLVPASSAVAAVTRAFDPTMRAPEGVVERIESGIPGLVQQVPPRLDAFGRPRERTQRGVESLINPITRSVALEDPIDQELRRLVESTGRGGGPAPVTRSTAIAGERLTRDERAEMQQLSGELAYEALARLFNTGKYLSAEDDEERRQLISTEIGKARRKAGLVVRPLALRTKAG